MSALAPSVLKVDLDAYAHNLRVVREKTPEDCAIIAVVKANGYGMGAVPVARRAVSEGAAMLAVSTVEEGIELREGGIEAPILVLVQPLREAFGAALENRLRVTVSDLTATERLGDVARKLKRVATVHCEVDTGMGRQGFMAESAAQEILAVTRISNVDIEGISTHFPSAETPADPFTANQIKSFKQLLKQLEKQGIPYEMVHASNSAGIANFSGGAFNCVRPGLMTYGVWPTETVPAENPLQPVAQWTSRVSLLKELPGGTSVGYGRSYRASNRLVAAVIPVGYADGYPFALSNNGEVIIRGARCPVRGRVSMDQIVVDVTQLPGVTVGDEVILMGGHGEKRITAEDLARQCETIPYEILSNIGPRVARVYGG